MKNAGIRLATVTPFGAFPLIDYLVATSRNVGEGLKRFARYLRLAEARSVPCLREDEDPIRVSLVGCDTPLSAEFTVTLNLLQFREETEGRFRAAYASFCHTPDDVVEIERLLGCPVYIGASWNGWALSREMWQLPLRRRDPALGSLLQRQADEALARLPPMDGLALDVRQALASRVGGGDTHIRTIARTLATSARSLQRRLAAAGVSYQQLLDLARKDAAERYLTESPLSIGEIAYLFGYSEPAAFNRAFRRWHRRNTSGVPTTRTRPAASHDRVDLVRVFDMSPSSVRRALELRALRAKVLSLKDRLLNEAPHVQEAFAIRSPEVTHDFFQPKK